MTPAHAAISRMRCTNLLAQVSDDNIVAVEAFLAVIVAGQVRQNDSSECDGSAPPKSDRTAPNTLADRDCDGTSAVCLSAAERSALGAELHYLERAICQTGTSHSDLQKMHARRIEICRILFHRETDATTEPPQDRDNAQVAVAGASRGGSNGAHVFNTGDRVCHIADISRVGVVQFVGGLYGGVRFITVDWGGGQVERHDWLTLVPDTQFATVDFDLDAATAEADCNALEALTGPGAPDWQPVPGEQVEVVEGVGSKTGRRVAIGTFRGEEADAGPAGGVWWLVEVYGVVRRYRSGAVGRVG